jgi:GNAT superfamily N-acetyltransferase
MIVESFLNKNYSVFPPTWTRLNDDVSKGAEGLAKELGDDGHLAVLFASDGKPVACGGVLPYRGDNWINEVDAKSDEELANASKIANKASQGSETGSTVAWEICCFCIHPTARGKGLTHQLLDALIEFIKTKGGRRLFTNYAIDEIGGFWTKLGFETVPGAGGMLPKGFKTDPTKEGLRADIHFRIGVKVL